MATIKDVAKASGVCPATVSQVLNNGSRPVRPETRERVLRLARELNYRPNAVARGLVKKRMNTIGLVVVHSSLPSHTNPFLTTILDGILAVNTRLKQNTTLCTIDTWEQITEHMPELTDGRCDGVLVIVPPVDCVLSTYLLEKRMPFVLVNAQEAQHQVSSVDVDNADAAFRMTEYLLGLGHRRIAFVYEPNESGFAFVQDRKEGYERALKSGGEYRAELSGISMEEFLGLDLALPYRPTAVFCAYDALALNIIVRLQERGISVPGEVSVVGFDDIPSISMGLPGLTTVRQPMAAIGEMAADMLQQIIVGAEPPGRREIIPTELVIRQSAAPPRV
jgi:DNA-binding LacI/PurR family transcriptional regulator